jgi:hypothetical protein
MICHTCGGKGHVKSDCPSSALLLKDPEETAKVALEKEEDKLELKMARMGLQNIDEVIHLF